MEIAELSIRVDEALATARASEGAVMTVAAAAFDAAEQARRAAELAERASAALLGTRPALLPPEPAGEIRVTAAASADDSLDAFNQRADRVAARLQALGGLSPASDAAVPKPAAG